jgi:aerobic-type carbon monoxide dehydrogenase small subunit (CoxS/CutS family)
VIPDVTVALAVNGLPRALALPPRTTLAGLLRDYLHLMGTKLGCNEGTCGSCTVLLDGRAVYSCMLLALDAAGGAVTTIEGLGTLERPHPLQETFADTYAAQCGYCTPGLIMAAKALLDTTPAPDTATIRQAIAGNLCKCAAYAEVVAAIDQAAQRLRRA